MGRTIPSFKIALAMEEEEWKPFLNALDKKSHKKKFDEMLFDIPRLYVSPCSYSVQPVRLYPILMSILFHHYKQLTECISEVERIDASVNERLMNKEKQEEPNTLDGYLEK
jgi:hypothetical protein